MFFRVLFRGLPLFALLLSAFVLNYFVFRSHAARSAEAKHGLTGSYYVGGGWDKDTAPPFGISAQIWSDPNDFNLPRTFTRTSIAPAVTRVDAQVAFGQGKGFQASGGGPAKPWWPTQSPAAAVFWRGYIHLPKAGTYYLGTISHGPSAVYLNQARVALNGIFGGVLVTDAFTYANEEVQDYVKNRAGGNENVLTGSNARDQYVVPVTIDAPRDVPIEVQYDWTAASGHDYEGIDLFWVTPDSPRDANGKPIAKIVPGDALYTEAPAGVEKPLVRRANSTISADHLYFPAEYVEGAVTVTVRLADKDGNPVHGKRVYVSSLTTYGNSDAIEQPEKPTDADGITTAKIRAGGRGYAHDSAIFATDMTDFVDVSQVAHVRFQQVPSTFFADKFSPYYDPRLSIAPPIPVVGKPATIATELKNNSKFAARVTVTFSTTDSNIGFTNYVEIARIKDITFQPGESKEVSTTFTPKEAIGHKCWRIEVEGVYLAGNSSGGRVFSAALMPAAIVDSVAAAPSPQGQQIKDDTQSNKGVVAAGCTPAGMALFTLLGGGIADFCHSGGGPCPPGASPRYEYDERPGLRPVPDESAGQWFLSCYGPGGEARIPKKPLPHLYISQSRQNPDGSTTSGGDNGPATPPATFPVDEGKDASAQGVAGFTTTCDGFLVQAQQANKAGNEAEYKAWMQIYYDCQRERGAWNRAAQDPPDAAYKRLAAPPSDTPAGYIDAARVSMERYRAAEEEGDVPWASRHLTAMELSFKHIADAERRAADSEERRAEEFAAKDAKSMEETQSDFTALFARLHRSGTTPEDLKRLESLGVSEEDAKAFYKDFLSTNEPPKFPGPRGALLSSAAMRRDLAVRAEMVASLSPTGRSDGKPFVQAFEVSNPHDKEETIDLFIRPVSIPPDWKLSVVNAEGQPKFKVREVEPGKHYAITLPARDHVKVTSVAVPVGEVGARTTARWAVEGKIGNELIGGMVHEMNVPYIIADLQLPPVGSKEIEEQLPPPSKAWMRIVAEVAAGIIVFGLLVYFFLFWGRGHRTGTSSVV